VRVRERKQREEGEGPLATGTATATNANPIVMLIMRLLAAAPVTNDESISQPGHSPQNNLGAARAQSVSSLCVGAEKWDKQNPYFMELCPGIDPRRSEAGKRSSLL